MEKNPIYSRFGLMSHCMAWRINSTKSIAYSTIEIGRRWTMWSIIVHRST